MSDAQPLAPSRKVTINLTDTMDCELIIRLKHDLELERKGFVSLAMVIRIALRALEKQRQNVAQ